MLLRIWGRWSRRREARLKKSCRESLKREQEVLVLAEERKAQGSVDENTKAIIYRGLKRIKKIREEEDEMR